MAVLATLATFAGMFLAYRFGLIKVTDKFRRIMTMAIIGYAIFAVVNFIFAVVTNTTFGIGGTGMLGIAHLGLRGRPGVVHPRARLRLDRAGDPSAPRRSTRGSSRTA